MRIVYLSLLFLLAGLAACAQRPNEALRPADRDSLAKHFYLSPNFTLVQNSNTENRAGFGAGAALSWPAESRVQLIMGVEYNQTRQFKAVEEFTERATYFTTTYTMYGISQPITGRVYLGRWQNWFLEGGGYLDFNIGGRLEGFYQLRDEDTGNVVEVQRYTTQRAGWRRATPGVCMAVGFRDYIGNILVHVKPEIKYSGEKIWDGPEDFYNSYVRISAGVSF